MNTEVVVTDEFEGWYSSLDEQDGDAVYRVVSRSGPDHAPLFTMAVVIPGLADGIGEGPAKRQAEIAAATTVLLREGVWSATNEAGART